MVAAAQTFRLAVVVLPVALTLQSGRAAAERAAVATPPTSLVGDNDARGPIGEREQQAEARRLRALRFWDLRSFPAAKEELLEAYALSPRPLFLYNLAVTSMALGDSAGAYRYFEDYLGQGGDSISAERRAMVERQLQDLAEHVASLHISADVVGAQVFLDGEFEGMTPLSRPLRLNAGDHSLEVRRGEGSQETRHISVRGGQALALHFALLARERHRAAETERTRWLLASWTGTALLGTGAALAGWKALASHDAYQKAFREPDVSRTQLDDLDSRARIWSITADALAVTAVASGAFSLYLTVKKPTADSTHGKTRKQAKEHRLSVIVSARAAYVTGTF